MAAFRFSSHSSWFPLSTSGPILGVDFAIIRWAGSRAQAAAGSQSVRFFVDFVGIHMGIDLDAMSTLRQVRQFQLAQLITLLRQSLQPPSLQETEAERRCLIM